MKKIASIACLAAALAYTAYLAVLSVEQDRLVFPTRPTDQVRAAAIAKYYKGMEAFIVNTPDGVALRGFFLPRSRQGRPAPAVLHFCGNAEEQSAFFLWAPAKLAPYSVAGVDYRGYGASEGTPSEAALKADALLVYDALSRKLGRSVPIVVMGRSLGTGIAAFVAAHRPVAGVILVSPYDSLVAVAKASHPFVPVGWLLRSPFDVAPDAARVTAPTLMLVAGADRTIPPRLARHLATLWAGPKTFETIVGASHASILDSPQYWKLIRGFLDRLAGVGPREPTPAIASQPAATAVVP